MSIGFRFLAAVNAGVGLLEGAFKHDFTQGACWLLAALYFQMIAKELKEQEGAKP